MNRTRCITCLLGILLAFGTGSQAQTPYTPDPGSVIAAEIEREQQQAEKIARQLDEALAAEKLDSEFAEKTESMVWQAVRTASPASQIQTLQCKSTMCRVVIRFDSGETLEGFMEELAFLEPFNTGGFGKLGRDGRTLSLYLQRQGHELIRTAAE